MSILIVGAGIFGQTIAAKLRKQGYNVSVFDRREKEAGSLPSGGHLKPSWLTSIPNKDLDASMETLEELFGLQKLDCEFLRKKVSLYQVDIEKALASGPVMEVNVTAVGNGFLKYKKYGSSIECTVKGTVIVAAGVWSSQLLPQFAASITARKGVSRVFEGGAAVSNLIHPWAPYKQIVRTYYGPNKVWIGDGSAIKPENWDAKRDTSIRNRIMPFAPKGFKRVITRHGLRPYLNEGLQKLESKLWIATGGGKSGTALAGVYANKLAEALQ